MKYEHEETFTTFTHDNQGVITSKTIRGDKNWVEHLQEFIYWLEGCGYSGVRDKVGISDEGLFSNEEMGWNGITFSKQDINQ